MLLMRYTARQSRGRDKLFTDGEERRRGKSYKS